MEEREITNKQFGYRCSWLGKGLETISLENQDPDPGCWWPNIENYYLKMKNFIIFYKKLSLTLFKGHPRANCRQINSQKVSFFKNCRSIKLIFCTLQDGVTPVHLMKEEISMNLWMTKHKKLLIRLQNHEILTYKLFRYSIFFRILNIKLPDHASQLKNVVNGSL